MKIINLPVANEPRKILTVKRRSENLKEHKEGFESANNPKGYVEEKRGVLPAEERLLEMLRPEWKRIERIRNNVYTLRKISKENGIPLQVNITYDTYARGMGYANWQKAMESCTDGEHIRNLNYGKDHSEFLSAFEGKANKAAERLRFNYPIAYGHKLVKNLNGATTFRKTEVIKDALKAMAEKLGLKVSGSFEHNPVEYVPIQEGERILILARETNPTNLPVRVIAREALRLPSIDVICGFGPIHDYEGDYVIRNYKYCLLKDKEQTTQEYS